ncbi:chorismate mutase 3, chloroplastic [Brachypodium distachyon]|uniref:chorismate mutase n=1 Tax=Brachypodium distachyon TaxID=15368 RepID=A0A0Q3GY12_BRADI|nr:chorismate mutase 3, chloroplastic [Brachypodium distachyon]KQK15895.1 hypothetical protein BRADI_1g25640v3 [Brachypodium distachyon]|eukprot:XP_010229649.1 chorismate mutase 3, chloroplastic [Brachypodium distachyon]
MVPRSLNSTSLPDADTPPPPPPPPIDPNDDAEEQLSAEAPDLAARLEALELAASERAADLSSSSRAGVILEEPAEPSSSKPWWSPPRGWRVAFSTATISDTLERLDDSIVLRLRGRALHCFNNEAYDLQCYPIIHSNGQYLFKGSLFQYLFFEDEKLHAEIARYKFSSYETPFLPSLLMEPITRIPWSLQGLHPAAESININERVLIRYFYEFLPMLVNEGSDGQPVSSSQCDVKILQALSNRIHYGKSVAESKFLEEPEKYTSAIREQDNDNLMETLTNPDAEEEVITRVKNKAMVYRQEVDPELVGELYDKLVIPMTKEVQVQYLLRRLD